MNIGALPAMIGTGNPSPLGTEQQQVESSMQSFGSVFAGIATKTLMVEQPKASTIMAIPVETIQLIFNAQTPEELEQALQAIPGNEKIELSKGLEAIESISTLEGLSQLLSIEPEKLLESLKKLLKQAGKSEDEVSELTMATPLWTLINMIDDVGVKFFDSFNESVDKILPKSEVINLLAFIKTVEIAAPKIDMTLPMEQRFFSFQTMVQAATKQFDEKVSSLNAGKQDILQFIQQKPNVRIVLEANSTSTTDSATAQKHSETATHLTNSSNTAITPSLKVEFSNTPSEITGSSRSESLMREMQTLINRSNFGQVGGSTRMLIKLYPEHLGQIRIELQEMNGVMTARILASTALAKGMLDSQLHQLRHAFTQQNLQVERIDITQSIQESSRNDREQSFNEQYKREQQTEEQRNKNTSEEEASFDEFMIELEA